MLITESWRYETRDKIIIIKEVGAIKQKRQDAHYKRKNAKAVTEKRHNTDYKKPEAEAMKKKANMLLREKET